MINEKQRDRFVAQRQKAKDNLLHYIETATQKKICEFLNSGKLDINRY